MTAHSTAGMPSLTTFCGVPRFPTDLTLVSSAAFRRTMEALPYVLGVVCVVSGDGRLPRLACYGQKVVIEEGDSYFPTSWADWCWCIPNLLGEMFGSRVIGGFLGGADEHAPIIGATVTVILPGEANQARCVYLHVGGDWEGVLLLPTLNERPAAHVRIANRLAFAQGTPHAFEAGLHDFKQGAVVRMQRRHRAWVPAEGSGGTA